jgi:hypothetical protein
LLRNKVERLSSINVGEIKITGDLTFGEKIPFLRAARRADVREIGGIAFGGIGDVADIGDPLMVDPTLQVDDNVTNWSRLASRIADIKITLNRELALREGATSRNGSPREGGEHARQKLLF